MATKFKRGRKVRVVASANDFDKMGIKSFDTMMKLLKEVQTIVNIHNNSNGEWSPVFKCPMYTLKSEFIIAEKFLKKA